MRRLLALILICSLATFGCKPTPPPDGVKTLYYWKGGPKRAENTYKNGVLEGPAKTFYKTKTLRSEMNYQRGKLHGDVVKYDPTGAVLGRRKYKNGVMVSEKIYAKGKNVTLKGNF